MSSVSTIGLPQRYPTLGQPASSISSYPGSTALLSGSPPADLFTPASSLFGHSSQTTLNSGALVNSMLSLVGMMLQMMVGTLSPSAATTTNGTTTGSSNQLSAFAKNNLSNIEGYFNQDDPTLAHIDDPPSQPAPDDSGEE